MRILQNKHFLKIYNIETFCEEDPSTTYEQITLFVFINKIKIAVAAIFNPLP
jgi:hypothetical protein